MCALPITRLSANIGLSAIYSHFLSRFSLFSQISPQVQMSALSLTIIAEGIFAYYYPSQEREDLSNRKIFKMLIPYLFIGTVYLFHKQTLKVTIISSLLLGTFHSIFNQFLSKIINFFTYQQQKELEFYAKNTLTMQNVENVEAETTCLPINTSERQLTTIQNTPVIRRKKQSKCGDKPSLKNRVSVTDQLFQEENKGVCSYIDHIGKDHKDRPAIDLYVEVKYHEEQVEPYKRKPNLNGQFVTFESRDALLNHEVTRRMKAVKHLPDTNRYVGFKLTGLQKIKRCFKVPIDQKLQDNWKTPLKPNYSARNIYNMTNTLHPRKEIRDQLRMKAHETYRLATRVTWAFNSSLNGYEFIDEKGRTIQIHNATTSSNDRTATNICMMRRVDDVETEQTIAYTGRPDTKEKAIEQVEFMFRYLHKKGHIKKESEVYILPYVVNNLLSPITGIGFFSFDEKEATMEEQRILQELEKEELEIDGKKVKIQPIYFSQPFNQTNTLKDIITDSHSGKGLSKKINRKGYKTLLPMAEKHLASMQEGKQKDLLQGAIRELRKEAASLLPEQELFNRAIICQILRIETVIHCKSSTDRTTLAIAISLVAYQWMKLDLDLMRNAHGEVAPHLILQNDAAKELIAGYCLASHQVTRIARTCEGSIRGHKIGTRILGFQWSSNPIAGRILPKRYIKINNISSAKHAGVGLLSTVGFLGNVAFSIPIWAIGAAVNKNPLFNPIYIKPGTSPFADHLVDASSPYVGEGEGRSLLKPEGMIAL